MQVKRTWIRAPITKVMRELWPYLRDDSNIDVTTWLPKLDDDSRWYIATEGTTILGAFWMERKNAATWEAHANVRPGNWGSKRGTEICQAAIKVMAEDTGALKIIALIPDCSPATQEMATAIGFEEEGVQKLSWLRNGKLYDQKHYGMTRK